MLSVDITYDRPLIQWRNRLRDRPTSTSTMVSLTAAPPTRVTSATTPSELESLPAQAPPVTPIAPIIP